MSSNKIGLVLSHIFVRDEEDDKFSWTSKTLKRYKKLDLKFFTGLCGHGIAPPSEIAKNLLNQLIHKLILNPFFTGNKVLLQTRGGGQYDPQHFRL